jgi:hypothetical protein
MWKDSSREFFLESEAEQASVRPLVQTPVLPNKQSLNLKFCPFNCVLRKVSKGRECFRSMNTHVKCISKVIHSLQQIGNNLSGLSVENSQINHRNLSNGKPCKH